MWTSFTGPKLFFGNFYWPGAIGSPLASSPVGDHILRPVSVLFDIIVNFI